jgi:hypothetical protein
MSMATSTKQSIASASPLKRSRNLLKDFDSFDSFDMNQLTQQAKEVKTSMDLPVIEWPAFDDDEKEAASPVVKRRCISSLRSFKASMNLYSLSCTKE